MSAPGVVVIGGGQAGIQAADTVRTTEPGLSVTIVADELDLPYQRPPLSKSLWAGDLAAKVLPLRPTSFYADSGIRLVTGTRATSIDRGARRVLLESGEELLYDALVLATGARARRIPLPGGPVYVLRTLPDGEELQKALASVRSVVVVGGGFLGLEVAAAATENGMAVTVLEAEDSVLTRSLSPDCSAWLSAFHRRRGTEVRCGTAASSVRTVDGAVCGVVTRDGDEIEADLVLLGVGAVPNVELAADAGLEVRDGIVVDAGLRTSDTAIWAIGDCARFPSSATGADVRLESVQNASDQGRCAGTNIVRTQRGEATTAYAAVPWFWSHQASARLQIAGTNGPGGLRVVTRRHDEDKISFLGITPGEGRLVVAESINAAADHIAARKMLAAGTVLDTEVASDPAVPLKSLLG